MTLMSSHHQTLTNGVGKCSVPMWVNGARMGFCNKDAYGRQQPIGPAYAPGLACPAHGGPLNQTPPEEPGMATHEPSDLTKLDFENIAREKKGIPPRPSPNAPAKADPTAIDELKAKINHDGDRQFGPSTVDIDRLCKLYEAEAEALQESLVKIERDYKLYKLIAKSVNYALHGKDIQKDILNVFDATVERAEAIEAEVIKLRPDALKFREQQELNIRWRDQWEAAAAERDQLQASADRLTAWMIPKGWSHCTTEYELMEQVDQIEAEHDQLLVDKTALAKAAQIALNAMVPQAHYQMTSEYKKLAKLILVAVLKDHGPATKDVDAKTGCADDQIWDGVSGDDLRQALGTAHDPVPESEDKPMTSPREPGQPADPSPEAPAKADPAIDLDLKLAGFNYGLAGPVTRLTIFNQVSDAAEALRERVGALGADREAALCALRDDAKEYELVLKVVQDRVSELEPMVRDGVRRAENCARWQARAGELVWVLEAVRQTCLFGDDDAGEIGVTTDPYISEVLFKKICTVLAATPAEALKRARARDECVAICRDFMRRSDEAELDSPYTYGRCKAALDDFDQPKEGGGHERNCAAQQPK